MADSPRGDVPVNLSRRRDRSVEDPAWIRTYLGEAPFGLVATARDGEPYLTPVNFAYEEGSDSLYFHGARAGRLFATIAINPRVCFNACRMGALILATEASGFDVEYDSVTVFGRARVLEEEAEAAHGLRLLLDKYAPALRYGEDYKAITPDDLARTAVYRIEIEAWSGKRNPAA